VSKWPLVAQLMHEVGHGCVIHLCSNDAAAFECEA
jgi:hypothetical protein